MKRFLLPPLGLVLLITVGVGGFALFFYKKPATWKDFLGPPASYFVDESKPPREQTILFEVAGRTFKIPQMYVDSNKPENGIYKDSILLEVIWPEMGSIYELENRAEYERIWKHERRIGWILLEAEAARPPLDRQVFNMRDSRTKIEQAGEFEGLEKELWYSGKKESPELESVVYIIKNTRSKIVDYINCRQNARFPRCSHKFVEDGIIYKISYDEPRFFKDWKQQKQRAVAFLDGMEVFSEQQPGP